MGVIRATSEPLNMGWKLLKRGNLVGTAIKASKPDR
jgi:hypothetical protein